MEDQKIEVGTVVMLKSGGPFMTVTEIRGAAANVAFFESHLGHECLEEALFPIVCLEAIDMDDLDDGGGESVGNVVDILAEPKAA